MSASSAAANFTDEQIEDLRQSFLLFDRSGDGAVDFRDLMAAFRVLGQNPREEEIKAIEKSKEEENIQSIDFPEFLDILNKRRKDMLTNREELHEAFHTFDRGSKNYLTEEELESAMRGIGDHPLDDVEWKEMLRKANFDEDGHLDFENFAKLVYNEQ